ncbi:hypothetical protein acsn021_14430 [Anaerocolumna cellulosilytica]|uniref:Uncharacterized protein n=1 Tax=Anaerocolumna cellulosilytica TaxID=433286 RepID=A0A6S6QTC1_9FIRM|nr:PTS glucose transporter subunit IIA [Anaerocolumna cellulosilytica]MBB5195630.1 phosphotransferase system IIA component [Anaerocolumna cellulosilytica]BCJ93874.1 hypothetical protein acsn021_14430 [Anaerocolumna cellulosilytica]
MQKSAKLTKRSIYQINSPLKGIAIEQTNIPDDILNTSLCGVGVGIVPNVGALYAPFDGVITDISENSSTLFLKSTYGLELMIQVGIHTELLDYSYFPNTLKIGDSFHRGKLLLTFNISEIQTSGYNTACSVLIRNHKQFKILHTYPEAKISPQNTLIRVSRTF